MPPWIFVIWAYPKTCLYPKDVSPSEHKCRLASLAQPCIPFTTQRVSQTTLNTPIETRIPNIQTEYAVNMTRVMFRLIVKYQRAWKCTQFPTDPNLRIQMISSAS